MPELVLKTSVLSLKQHRKPPLETPRFGFWSGSMDSLAIEQLHFLGPFHFSSLLPMPLLHLYLFLRLSKVHLHFCTCEFSNFHILISLFPCHYSIKQAFTGSSFSYQFSSLLYTLLVSSHPFLPSPLHLLSVFLLSHPLPVLFFLLHLLFTFSSPISSHFFLHFPLHSLNSLLLAQKRSGPSKDLILFLCTLTSLPPPINLVRVLPLSTASMYVQPFLQKA